jgi:hypothetical protein
MLSVGLAGVAGLGGAQDAALRQQERVPGGAGHACRHAAGRHRCGLQDMGAYLAKQPEVRDLQGYAGTASPITFNGLVRQYYLRADAEQGDLQVNLVDKAHRARAKPCHCAAPAPGLEEDRHPPRRAHQGGGSAARPAGDVALGGRDLRPGRSRPPGNWPSAWRRPLATPPTSWASTPACRKMRRALPARAAPACRVPGHPVAVVAQTVQAALSGHDAAYLHDGQSKYPVPVRIATAA